ncbi:hypothetical protein BDW_08290 [Bdellovibrio bacteriovorus W]|nr:hypothetical protein BDW_08290 [Bdellovibrio bacteriovorus W]
MEFIFILEDDVRIQKELWDSLRSINPQLCLRFFHNLEEFHVWLKQALHEGPLSLANAGHRFLEDTSSEVPPAEKDQLRLIIANNNFLGTKNMSLLKRARDFFIRKKLCSTENPTSLVLTAFDSPDFDIKLAEERIINNVIFKPFDKLILKQHLSFALSGRHPLATADVASFQMHSTLEMLKEVCLHSLSEIGFSSCNNHPISAGAISKYYSEYFESNRKKSLYAVCTGSEKLAEDNYLCHFQFYGADNQQIQSLRRLILQDKAHQEEKVKRPSPSPKKILILEENSHSIAEIESALQIYFENIELHSYESFPQLLADLADKDTVQKKSLPNEFDYVFVSYQQFETEPLAKKDQLCQALSERKQKHAPSTDNTSSLKDCRFFVISRRSLEQDQIRDMAKWAQEVFFYPLEKSYIAKKLSQLTKLSIKRELDIKSLTVKSADPDQALIASNSLKSLKVANPVEITQISEAGLILKYYRAMGIGGFREFILWRPNELENPEIIGTVNFTEKDRGSEAYLNHFVFFGMTDFYLKHLRLWLRDAYIRSKAEGAS